MFREIRENQHEVAERLLNQRLLEEKEKREREEMIKRISEGTTITMEETMDFWNSVFAG